MRRAAVAALIAVLGAACHSGGSLPSGADLLHRAAVAMGTVRSVHFTCEVQGPPGPLGIRRGDGVLDRQGEAEGTASLQVGQSLIEYRFVFTGGILYLKGPTGGFQKIPAAVAAGSFDPASLLSADRGVAHLLATATAGHTLDAESVGGTSAYRVDATIAVDGLADLLPPGAGRSGVAASVWIGRDRPLPLQIRAAVPPARGSEPSVVTVTLDSFDRTVSITPPG